MIGRAWVRRRNGSQSKHHVPAGHLAHLLTVACIAQVLLAVPVVAVAEELPIDEAVAGSNEAATVVVDEAAPSEPECDVILPDESATVDIEQSEVTAEDGQSSIDVIQEAADDQEPCADDAVEGEGTLVVSDENQVADASDDTQIDTDVTDVTEVSEGEPLALKAAEPEPENVAATSKWAGGHWAVNASSGSLQRYWVSKDGEVFKNGLVLPEWGAGYYAWARDNGWIVRGSYSDGSYVWFADNNGKLANLGWVVSSGYGQGLQRYYIVDEGVHAARIGYNEGNGKGVWAHYTTKQGYVLRGRAQDGTSKYYIADNDGRLPSVEGWLVTKNYSDKLERYYFEDGAAKTGSFSVDGKWYVGLVDKGYVVRGYDAKNLAYANNDGVLATNRWLVTNMFGQGYQRYWLGSNGLALRNELVDIKLSGYRAYARPDGIVVRGKFATSDGRVFLADNNGKLEADGWLVTNKYDGKLQRYYIDPNVHAAVVGYSTDEYPHYTLPKAGYVARGVFQQGNYVYLADNNGKMQTMSKEGWLVTAAYDANKKLQRYYLEQTNEGAWAAKVGYSEKGYAHYTMAGTGAVVRNELYFVKDNNHWYRADGNGCLTPVNEGLELIIERYLQLALNIANDESHGYSQFDRWGPDYDCSSLVISCVRKVGLDVGDAYSTRDMLANFMAHGWTYIKYDGNPSSLKRGDVLLEPGYHTEFYLGNSQRVGARTDENGGIGIGAKHGDQTGQEIAIRNNVGTWFSCVLRLTV